MMKAPHIRGTLSVLALVSAYCTGAAGQTSPSPASADLEERVRNLEQENQELRKQVQSLKRIRSEWFQWKYGLTPPEMVRRDEAEREGWEKLDDLIELLGLQPGSTIADIGAGHGFFTFRFAPVVGSAGKVYAVEIDETLVSRLKRRAGDSKVDNVHVVLATATDPNLPSNSLDAIFIADVYHEMSDQAAVLERLGAALKPGGKLLVMDYITDKLDGQPRDVQQVDHAISPELVVVDLQRAGFTVDRVINPFNTDHPAGISVYLVVAKL